MKLNQVFKSNAILVGKKFQHKFDFGLVWFIQWHINSLWFIQSQHLIYLCYNQNDIFYVLLNFSLITCLHTVLWFFVFLLNLKIILKE